jgi:hypothetical protein
MNTDQHDVRDLLRDKAQMSPSAPSWVPELGRVVRRKRARTRSFLAVAVVALIAAGTTGIALAGGPDQDAASIVAAPPAGKPSHQTTIEVNGKSVPYAGAVPWVSPVAEGAASRVLTVFADGDRAAGNLCGLPVERVSVTESSTSVMVLVSGYGTPLPAGIGCAGTGHTPQPQRIALKVPLGSRVVIDASDNAQHPVLDVRTVPQPTKLPVGFAALPLSWDETTGFVERGYLKNADGRESISLGYGDFGPDGSNAPSGQVVGQTTIAGSISPIWRQADGLTNDITTFKWTPAGKKTIQLSVAGTAKEHLSVSQAIEIARSVR